MTEESGNSVNLIETASCAEPSILPEDHTTPFIRSQNEDWDLEGTPAEVVGRIIDEIGTTRRHLFIAILLGFANSVDAVEVTSFAYILTVVENPFTGKLVADDPLWSGLLTSAVYVGMLIGGIISGLNGDRFGRKPVLVFSMFVNSLFAIASAITTKLHQKFQLPWLLVCRFGSGLGVGGTIPSVFTLTAEISSARSRGYHVNVVAFFWMFGLLGTAILARCLLYDEYTRDYRSENWPAFAFVAGIPAGICATLCGIFLIESPRYLIIKGENAKAARSLSFLAGAANQNSVVREAILTLKERDTRNCRTFNENGSRNSFQERLKIFSEKEIQKTAILIGSIWFLLSFAGYGISTWIAEIFKRVKFDDPYAASILFALSSFPGNLMATLSVEKIGRKRLLVYSFGTGALAAFVFSLATDSKGLVLACVCIYQASITSCWNTIDAISAESFPSVIRSFAFGLMTAAGRIGAVTGNILNSVLFKNTSVGVLLAITGCSLTLASLAAGRLKDMTGRSLREL